MSVRVIVREAGVSDSPDDLALLDPGERSRAQRKRQTAPFVTGHALARRVLAELVDRDPAELVFERRCATCDSDRHGKPRLVDAPGWHFSLSYTPTVAVVAVAAGADVGIDIEDLTEADFDGFAGATLARDEIAGFDGLVGHDLLVARAQVWARKEAVLKATGHGLVVDPSEVLVSGPLEAPALRDWRADEPRPAAISLSDVQLDTDDHRASIAVLAPGPLEVVVG